MRQSHELTKSEQVIVQDIAISSVIRQLLSGEENLEYLGEEYQEELQNLLNKEEPEETIRNSSLMPIIETIAAVMVDEAVFPSRHSRGIDRPRCSQRCVYEGL